MRSKQYFTSIKNNPHEISTDPKLGISTIEEALCLFCCDSTQNAVFRFHASMYYQVLPRNLEGVK